MKLSHSPNKCLKKQYLHDYSPPQIYKTITPRSNVMINETNLNKGTKQQIYAIHCSIQNHKNKFHRLIDNRI